VQVVAVKEYFAAQLTAEAAAVHMQALLVFPLPLVILFILK
jgi:hypothetical protein